LINLIDGMDGLATGLGMFLTLTLAVVGISTYHQFGSALPLDTGFISLVVSGALLGFLLFNFPPAKIFLGDGGAYFIGFFIAATSLTSANKGAIVAPLLVVFIALGIPIIDTTFAILRRGIKGLPLFRADADHIHHRLLQLGFSKSNALFTLYAIAGVLSLIGLSFYWAKGFALPIAGGAIFILALLGARYLGYVESWRDIRRQVRRALRHRREIQYATILGDLTEMDVDRCHSADEFWIVFDRALARLHLYRSPDDLIALGEEPSSVSIEIPHSPAFTLHYPKNHPTSKNWRALASSMHPAYVNAVDRWGDCKQPPLRDVNLPTTPARQSTPAQSG
ncbi:MAG: MraY family glycosyltransferase, partial [Verrucomicrobiales bacterium]|nr:MraY family glycosyltransferase [Verrucomicrobiales bacterium]